MYERWLALKNNPNYEVSNMGNVRNCKTGRYLKPQLNQEGGYYRVSISGKHYYVHRLVADTFFDGDHEKIDVNHIDGNKYNNTLSNLEWVTRKENIRHAYINGLKYPMIVKVVRCKFCIHRKDSNFCASQPDDFYCSNGERR